MKKEQVVRTLEEEGFLEDSIYDVYEHDARLHLEEDDELSIEEEGFMDGYEQAG
jgi:hypothetical protein